jgi:hypothetical protein
MGAGGYQAVTILSQLVLICLSRCISCVSSCAPDFNQGRVN